MDPLYGEKHRLLQEKFDTTRLADRVASLIVHDKVTAEERIPLGARIRDVIQAPDGSVYALTDENRGKILRLTLENSPQ